MPMLFDRLVNLTGRQLDLFVSDADSTPALTLPASDVRVSIPIEEFRSAHSLCLGPAIPLLVERWAEAPEGMPEAADGVLYVVTQPVAEALWRAGRRDVARPGRPIFRDGRQAGVVGLVHGREA